jgi:hypothetical protein
MAINHHESCDKSMKDVKHSLSTTTTDKKLRTINPATEEVLFSLTREYFL